MKVKIGSIFLLTLVVLAAIFLLDIQQVQANSDLSVPCVGIHQNDLTATAQIDPGDVREYPLLTRQECTRYNFDNLYKNESNIDQATASDGIDVKLTSAQRQKLNCPLSTSSASIDNLQDINRAWPRLT